MGLTKAERHNRMLESICNPEIERLRKVTKVSEEILNNLKERVDIDYCAMSECHVIDIIQRTISKHQRDLLQI